MTNGAPTAASGWRSRGPETKAASGLKDHLRTLLGEDSLAWRSLHGVNIRLQRMFPPPLEPLLSLEAWTAAGRPAPPPHAVKERIVSDYAGTFSTGTLVETGTYAGDMVFAMRDRFERIFSIELSEALCRRATRRFRASPGIRILQGDSGEALPRLLGEIATRCLFWLDGHCSAGITAAGNAASPALTEVAAILNHRIDAHVILIDDARLFHPAHGFPALSELQDLVVRSRPKWEFAVRNDVIRIHPRQDFTSEF